MGVGSFTILNPMDFSDRLTFFQRRARSRLILGSLAISPALSFMSALMTSVSFWVITGKVLTTLFRAKSQLRISIVYS